MSWSTSVTSGGKRLHEIVAGSTEMASAKDQLVVEAIIEIAKALGQSYPEHGVTFATSGHLDSHGGNLSVTASIGPKPDEKTK